MHKVVTLCFVRNGNQLLLGMKKRGFGEGRWNGFGGKIEPGESTIDAAKRELLEESGLTAHELTECAKLHFDFETVTDTIECTVFFVDTYSGEPLETDEMRPQWFDVDTLPFEHMWTDDQHWVPLVLDGKYVKATFHFKDLTELRDFAINCVEKA